jgi:hypothetical protein
MLKSFIIAAALLVSGSAFADWGNGRTEYVRCESRDYRYESCQAWGLRRVEYVRIVQQHSRTNCIRGQNWRPTRYGVDVWGGCRATFAVSGW